MPRKNFWADTSPTKSFVANPFLRSIAGEPTVASSCQSGFTKLLSRPQADHLLRDRITVARAKMTISSKSFAPNSERERESCRPFICIFIIDRGLPRIPSILPNAVYRQPYRGAFRDHGKTAKGKKQCNNERVSNSNNMHNLK